MKNEVRAKKLLSLVTFFAAAKKVTPAPGRGALIDRHEKKNQKKISEFIFELLVPWINAHQHNPRPIHFLDDDIEPIERNALPF